MASVLLLAVNRHQERYFSAIAQAAEDIDIRVLHDNKLPVAVLPRRLSKAERDLIASVRDQRLKTVEQESPGFKVSGTLRSILSLYYFLSCYIFFLRTEKFFAHNAFQLIGLWNGMKWRQKITRYVIAGTDTLFFENGAFPDTTTVDAEGVNYASSIPRSRDFYLSYSKVMTKPLPDRLTERKPKKAPAIHQSGDVPLPDRYLFVPFQVDSDTQIVEYSPWIKNMEHLYSVLEDVVRVTGADLPVIVIKEHPSSKNDYRYLHSRNGRILFYNNENTQILIEQAEAIVTINSSVGFESILLEKPVVTLGNAFYNIDGLVSHAESVDTLIAACRNFVPPESLLRQRFLDYLYGDYYAEGDWRTCDSAHAASVLKKIRNILEY
ncbi:MAG: capsular biosynthesis protein [Oceanospirillaceae bacterium]|uniref:capsular polysaccharide export protein, LipB/KpsS family n=1 Tax=unclassified Thalassolituus TaxID=2624967 RepID=UPI000C60BFB8|nr:MULTISPECIES: hypothetical protein [unclassified Thalassolituus]MAS26189.1 capsular biosynthesis protein [Oceanospirillaceae bacterium]MBL33301.1 capsular biosynthesis protein [Oceanospirillaceae bacterium]MBS54379.1 capsular biosynthesis protein [Oceanospirillaceae bacterium]